MKFFSMFTGVGGFELGIEQAFMEQPLCVGMCETDKHAKKVLEEKFKGVKNYGDVTRINTEELPEFDLLVGGTPCQDFSIAGRRKGLRNDEGGLTRSGLFYHFLRVARDKQPALIIMENVLGMLSQKNKSDGQYAFDEMMEALCNAGYVIDFTVLNSRYFGVPQNRARVFVLAIREDLLDESEVI